jgi:hypothetical protein
VCAGALQPQPHSSATMCRPCRHSLDDLEALVREKFSAVPAKPGVTPPAFPPDAITEGQEGLLIRMVPEREGHSIELQVGEEAVGGWSGVWMCVGGWRRGGEWMCLSFAARAGGMQPAVFGLPKAAQHCPPL